MRVKVLGGTARGDEPSLCTTCRHASVITGARLRDEITTCTQLYPERRITFPVRSCSMYDDRRRPSLRQMEDIGWVLRSDVKRHSIGFVQPKDLKPGERFRLTED